MSNEETLATLEKEISHLKEELVLSQEAKLASEACEALLLYSEAQEEPFSTSAGPNDWHKGAGGGGGCIIL